MELTLYYQPGTRSQRVRWMLEELELDYQLEHIDLFKGDANTAQFRALHPLGQLPVIMINGSPMFESGGIVQWLADSYPDKGFSPALETAERRKFNQWMYFSVTSLESPAWQIILHRSILPEEVAVQEIIPYATNNLLEVFAVLDRELDNRKYMLGDRFSAVDIMSAYVLKWFPEQLSAFPRLENYTQNLLQRPAYIRSARNSNS